MTIYMYVWNLKADISKSGVTVLLLVPMKEPQLTVDHDK